MEEYLKHKYTIIFTDFQEISTAEYRDEFTFTKAFMRLFTEALEVNGSEAEETVQTVISIYETAQMTLGEIAVVAERIYQYTSGYPYLVSAICKILDQQLPEERAVIGGEARAGMVWSGEGIEKAVKIIVNNKLSLFDSMIKQLDVYPELKDMIEQILYEGKEMPFNPDIKSVDMGLMFGFLKEKDGQIVIVNRIFEMRLLNMYEFEEANRSDIFQKGQSDKNLFIQSGRLDMGRVLKKKSTDENII